MPARKATTGRSYYNMSAECWDLYTEVLATEYSNAFLFGQIHQLTVDTYAVQHAGGPHPDKSVDIHLSGLYLALQKGIAHLTYRRCSSVSLPLSRSGPTMNHRLKESH